MTTASESPLTFSDLARLVIGKEKKALTVDEIWAVAEQTGLVLELKGTGKTPKATLGARLYTDAKMPDGLFAKVGARPAKFILKSLLGTIPKSTLEKQLVEISTIVPKTGSYAERDLHPLLVRICPRQLCRKLQDDLS
ncbi:MAG: HTH domain-containing protein [Thermoguttaceae bacterium]